MRIVRSLMSWLPLVKYCVKRVITKISINIYIYFFICEKVKRIMAKPCMLPYLCTLESSFVQILEGSSYFIWAIISCFRLHSATRQRSGQEIGPLSRSVDPSHIGIYWTWNKGIYSYFTVSSSLIWMCHYRAPIASCKLFAILVCSLRYLSFLLANGIQRWKVYKTRDIFPRRSELLRLLVQQKMSPKYQI